MRRRWICPGMAMRLEGVPLMTAEGWGYEMKGTIRLIRRFLLLVVCVVPVLFFLNLGLFVAYTWRERSDNGGWQAAIKVGEELSLGSDGQYHLSAAGQQELADYDAWAILVEDGTGDVVWHSEGLPEEIPLHYSAAEISWYTRGYIADYPTTVGARGDDLVIMGHPKTAYWKLLWNTFDYGMIAGLPRMLLSFLLLNGALAFLIYMILGTGILRSVKPVVQGMEALPEEDVYVREKGFLSEVAGAVNRVNEKLRAQERALRRRENARAGWISGVSHDIRTPLTMVLGYAAKLEEDVSLPEEARVIRLQSVKMKNLVGNLNLASKLEYQMQPVRMEELNLTAVLRQAAADFANEDLEGRYPIDFRCQEGLGACRMRGDRELLQRAVYNVLSNSRQHNPEGCSLLLELETETGKEGKAAETGKTGKEGKARIRLSDDGVGVSEEQLETLRSTPHYMMDSGTGVQLRHGLGLLIVRQIVTAHGGQVRLDHGPAGGFLVEIFLDVLLPNQGTTDLPS